jgi:hypothetical protein
MYSIRLITAIVFFSFFTAFQAHSDGGRTGVIHLDDKPFQFIDGREEDIMYVYNVVMKESKCDRRNIAVLDFTNNDMAKEIYSSLLMAKASGRQVDLIAKCHTFSDQVKRPSISSVYVY